MKNIKRLLKGYKGVLKLGTAYWSSSLTRSMKSGVGYGSWYAGGGGGRAGCGN
jgi:hypothetical protein